MNNDPTSAGPPSTALPPTATPTAPSTLRNHPSPEPEKTLTLYPRPVPQTPPVAPLAPPGYEILEEIGHGGMGIIYKARDVALERIVALKMLHYRTVMSPELAQRLRVEAESLAQLRHPHIVGIYSWGTLQEQPYFVLEYVEGGTLAEKLNGQPLPIAEAVRMVILLAGAVQYAHEHGIIHRDLKSANILLDPTVKVPALTTLLGAPKINDFGLAKQLYKVGSGVLTPRGMIMGTPSYMAPEQARGESERIGPPADVYALGAILYELLTGRPPFVGTHPLDPLLCVLTEPPKPIREIRPEVPEALEKICLTCLDKELEHRYPSAALLIAALEAFQQGDSATPSPVEKTAPTPSRPRTWLSLGWLCLILLILLLAWLAFSWTP
jgi:serine/threonine-protein kinase